MQPIIRVNQLSKKYQLGAGGVGYDTLRDKLVERFRSPFKNLRRRNGNSSHDWIWALKNVDFEVMPGEVVGIIGRNGAGKSTLLKILSRITEPTSGRVELHGRVGSLLEVGTGFHPELTGRENVYLNGVILGMTRQEVDKKFDEIVSFAEIEKFLDTPVKHYSSGMYMRLAFAVAAHLEPEILIVDEVLAVGDAEFQKKCLTKMGSAAREGRTVLFVSHNLAAVRALCQRTLVIENGEVTIDSGVEAGISKYLSKDKGSDAIITWDPETAPQTPVFRFVRAYIKDHLGEYASTLDHSREFTIGVEYEILKPLRKLRVGLLMQTVDGIAICGANDPGAWPEAVREPGYYVTTCSFPAHVLNTGTYVVAFGVDNPPNNDLCLNTTPCLNFTVEVLERQTRFTKSLPGIIRPKLNWKIEKTAPENLHQATTK